MNDLDMFVAARFRVQLTSTQHGFGYVHCIMTMYFGGRKKECIFRCFCLQCTLSTKQFFDPRKFKTTTYELCILVRPVDVLYSLNELS